MRRRIGFIALTLVTVAAASAAAQQRPPVRPIGAVVAKSTEVLGTSVTSIRQLPGGRVLVNDVQKRRVLLFDPSLATFTVVADSTSATANAYSGRIGALIPYTGDSTIFVDPTSLSMLVIDGNGKVGRVMSVPRSQDAMMLAVQGAAIDAKGRLIYRAPPNIGRMSFTNGVMTPPEIPDSAAIVRIDLATRQMDTLGFMKTPKVKFDISRDDNGGMRMATLINPLPVVDDWAPLPDGSVAFVRGRDYHVDFVNVDGTKTSAAKIPFDWQRMTDEDKSAFIDSLKAARERLGANAPTIGLGAGGPQMVIVGSANPEGVAPARPGGAAPGARGAAPPAGGPRDGGPGSLPNNIRVQGPGGGPAANIQLNFIPATELPDYKPPFFAGSVRADTEGNLWIRTIPTKAIPGGPVYDVVNRKGEIVERVQLPENRTIVGFGSDGTVYLTARNDTSVYLEKAKIR
jgi:hypothetical protein